MGTAKVVSLSVRPFQVTHLCFEADGILGQLNVELGSAAVAFNFAGFYATLGAMPPSASDPTRLNYNFLEIQAFTAPSTLASLRAEPNKAALNKAINARQNAWFAKYGHITAIVNRMNLYYSPATATSKPNRLARLAFLSQVQADELSIAYTADGRTGVVRNTTSSISSFTASGGDLTETGQTNDQSLGTTVGTGVKLHNLPPGGGTIAGWGFTGDGPVSDNFQESTNSSTTQSSGWASQREGILNTDYAYRVPYWESEAQNQRAQISLIDEQFSQYMSTLNLPFLPRVLLNELNSIDGDVFRLQIAYLNTILMSPIAGTVTGVYKQPGDAVKAGEPVIRVEDSSTILLVANIVHRDPIAVGATVTVTTQLFGGAGAPTLLSGNVVAVRGRAEDDEQWEVVAKCGNLDGAAKPIFPLGYHFDYDDTSVSIV
jgi:hypothetical protein